MSPTLAVGNIGLDTNVFNTPTDPTRDFTVSFLPATREWLPVGPLLLSGKTGVPLTYFEKSTTQRSVELRAGQPMALNLIRASRPMPRSATSSSATERGDQRPGAAGHAIGHRGREGHARRTYESRYELCHGFRFRLPDTVVFGEPRAATGSTHHLLQRDFPDGAGVV